MTAALAGILPYGTRVGPTLAYMPLRDLRWPLGAPDNLYGGGGRVGDLGEGDHLIAYPGSRLYYMPRPGVKCRLSLMIVEPEAVHGRHMKLLTALHRRFFRVLTCNRKLLSAIPNGKFFVFGSTSLGDAATLDTAKTRPLSLIASARRTLEGHRLRHEIVEWMTGGAVDADVMGRGYRPFDEKSEGLARYRYSVVIENVRERSYFTEKLIDCLLCDTIPIYWGAPDIGDFFDARGMLICRDADDIKAAVSDLPAFDHGDFKPYVAINRKRANLYADHELNAARLISTGRMFREDP